jgi:acetolactate synthase-1/2/3 large subunit
MVVISGAEIITKSFEDNEVKFVFSLPGGPILPMYDSLRQSRTARIILVRHEGAGSMMADAYSKVTGKVGVCMSTMGPGAENMTIGVGTARSDSVPLLAITGQLSTAVIGRGFQQETDHVRLFEPITKWSTQLQSTAKLPTTMKKAFYIAREGRPGPVHLDIPIDVQLGNTEIETGDVSSPTMFYSPAPPADSIAELTAMLAECRRPVILAGGGVVMANASIQLTTLAEKLHIPVVTSYNGRGAISEELDQSLGRAGEYAVPIPGRVLGESDLILVLGYRFTDVSTEGWRPSKAAKIIQVDVDSRELGRNYKVDLAIHSDVGLFLELLLSMIEAQRLDGRLRRDEWLAYCAGALAEWKRGYQQKMLSNAKPIKPQRVVHEINKRLPHDAIVAAGAGRCKMWAATLIPIRAPHSWVHSGGYAPMGYALCGAIGAKFAEPKKQVLAVDGDAAFQMHCQEIATARENGISFVVCVLNDMSLGAIRSAQVRSYGGHVFGTEFKMDVNTASVAEAFGGAGERVDDPEGIGPALDRALSSRVPYVIDIVVDREENPIFH